MCRTEYPKEVKDWAAANKLPLSEAMSKPALVTGNRLLDKIDQDDLQLEIPARNGHVLEQGYCATVLGLFNRLGWVPCYVESRIALCTLACKRSRGMVPSYLEDCLKKNSENHSRSTRYCNLNFLCPTVKRKTEGGRTFAVSACIEWNSLFIKTKRAPSLKTFRKKLFCLRL